MKGRKMNNAHELMKIKKLKINETQKQSKLPRATFFYLLKNEENLLKTSLQNCQLLADCLKVKLQDLLLPQRKTRFSQKLTLLLQETSQEQLQNCKVSYERLKSLKLGISQPTLEELVAISNFFTISLDHLIKGE